MKQLTLADAIRLAAPGLGYKRIARELFGGRVSHVAIAHWMHGRTKPVHWAGEILRAELRRRAELHQQAAQAIPLGDPRQTGAAALRRWRANRAKEKAGI